MYCIKNATFVKEEWELCINVNYYYILVALCNIIRAQNEFDSDLLKNHRCLRDRLITPKKSDTRPTKG